MLDFLKPVDTFEKEPEAADAAQQANHKTDCKQIHFLTSLDVRHKCFHHTVLQWACQVWLSLYNILIMRW